MISLDAVLMMSGGGQMFIVKWVTHLSEIAPIETEDCLDRDLDDHVSSCLKRLPDMRLKPFDIIPDGFLILDDTGHELRRWFGSPRPRRAERQLPRQIASHPPEPRLLKFGLRK